MKLLNKIEVLLYSIAGDDDGLKDELDRIGVKGVLAVAVTITVMCGLTVYMWVVS
jgi:hypothetical protein